MSRLITSNTAPLRVPPVMPPVMSTPGVAYPGAVFIPPQPYYNPAFPSQPSTLIMRPQINIPAAFPPALYHPRMLFYNPYVRAPQDIKAQNMVNQSPNPSTPNIVSQQPAQIPTVSQIPATPLFTAQSQIPATPQFTAQSQIPTIRLFTAQSEIRATPQFTAQSQIPATPQFTAQSQVPTLPQVTAQSQIPTMALNTAETPATSQITAQVPALPQNEPRLATADNNSNYLFALTLFQGQRFGEFQSFIKNNKFDRTNMKRLQDMWYDSIYITYLKKTNQRLSAMIRFRLRKQYPLPSTIWDGDYLSYNLKQSARNILIAFFNKNRYPSRLEKRVLADKLGIDVKAVITWFKNRRSRSKPSSRDRSSSGASSTDGAPTSASMLPLDGAPTSVSMLPIDGAPTSASILPIDVAPALILPTDGAPTSAPVLPTYSAPTQADVDELILELQSEIKKEDVDDVKPDITFLTPFCNYK